MAPTSSPERLLNQWFPHTTTPFIANAPMLGFTDCRLAGAVIRAGGLGMITPSEMIHFDWNLDCVNRQSTGSSQFLSPARIHRLDTNNSLTANIGFIGGGFEFGPESTQLRNLDARLTQARAELGTIASTRTLPLGIGFITFTPTGFEENAVSILEKHRVAAVWLSFPKSGADHQPLIEAIRKVQSKGHWDVKIFVQVGTVHAAKEALEQGVDVLVVQGVDAGGHQWAQGASLMSLLPEIRDLVARSARVNEVAIMAAGGIVDGRGCVAALGLGELHHPGLYR